MMVRVEVEVRPAGSVATWSMVSVAASLVSTAMSLTSVPLRNVFDAEIYVCPRTGDADEISSNKSRILLFSVILELVISKLTGTRIRLISSSSQRAKVELTGPTSSRTRRTKCALKS
jgi:hypothetical protein